MNKIQKAKSIQKEINYWFESSKECSECSELGIEEYMIKCIPDYINCIDDLLAKAERLGVDGLLDLQSIHNDITKYTKIYYEAIKEDN